MVAMSSLDMATFIGWQELRTPLTEPKPFGLEESVVLGERVGDNASIVTPIAGLELTVGLFAGGTEGLEEATLVDVVAEGGFAVVPAALAANEKNRKHQSQCGKDLQRESPNLRVVSSPPSSC